MITLSRYTSLLIASLACCAAQASEPLSVSVAGRIAPTNNCIPTLSNADLDYGEIKSFELNRDRPTFLPEKTFTLTVACQDKVNRLSIRFQDHRPDDAIRDTAVIRHPLCTHAHCGEIAFGLGQDKQRRKIGAFFLMDKGATIDGQPVNWWSSSKLQPAPGTRFAHHLLGPYTQGSMTTEYSPASWKCDESAGSYNAPCFAGKHFSMPIGVIPVIDSKDRDVSDDMPVNGALTVEIRTL